MKKIESKKEFAKLSLSMIFGGGLIFVIGLILSFIIIGIPLAIGGIVVMAIGFLGLIASPFVKIQK